MIAPFLLVEGLDVSLHPSLDALTNWAEAQDVRNGVYEAFDAEGRVVKLRPRPMRPASQPSPATRRATACAHC